MFGGGEGVFPKQHNEILSGYGMLTVKREGEEMENQRWWIG